MKILGLQKLTLLDFPQRTAATIFLGGCNFRCPFCHNGDLVTGNFPEEKSEDEIIKFLEKRKGILDGVCITGGEPLLNNDIPLLLKKIKAMGFLVKTDTNGTRPDFLKKLVESELIDYVAMDIKNSKQRYCETVGLEELDLCKVEESVDFLKENRIDYEFRTTVVAEYHDDESFEEIGKWIGGAKRYFLQRFEDSEYVLKKGLHSPEEQELTRYRDIAKKYIEQVEIRGV